jgi:UDP-glucose 4-epimerase
VFLLLKILITGGAGFIGHNLALYLKNSGYNVIALDNLERSTNRALLKLKELEIPLIKCDVRDKYELKPLIEDSNIVIHMAAYISVDESFEKPQEYIVNNVGGTVTVAKTCLEYNKPLIYISSAAVYGNPLKTPISENHPLNPISPYGLSKLMGELIVEFYGKLGLNYIILRPFNVYGPGQSDTYAGVITKFTTRACRGEPLIIYGDGLQTRDFIHVNDFSKLVELVIEKTPYGEVFNAGSGIPTRIVDLARLIIKLINVKVEILYAPPRPGDIRESWADISKAHRLLGYHPTITLEEGLRDTIREICGDFTRS